MNLASGTRLGAYEILGPLGVGGMGEVYRASDTKLKRDVAIKILPEAFVQDENRIRRFEREAHVLAALNHRNLAAIYGLVEAEGVQALVLELVEGPTLVGDRRAVLAVEIVAVRFEPLDLDFEGISARLEAGKAVLAEGVGRRLPSPERGLVQHHDRGAGDHAVLVSNLAANPAVIGLSGRSGRRQKDRQDGENRGRAAPARPSPVLSEKREIRNGHGERILPESPGGECHFH